MAKEFKCKNPECPSKGKAQESILVTSECCQTLSLPDDEWTDLESTSSSTERNSRFGGMLGALLTVVVRWLLVVDRWLIDVG
jgi:hypothetical protein